MLGYLSADIICSEKRRVFRERSSRKTVSYEEQIMSKDKYPNIFSPQMEAIVFSILQFFFAAHAVLKIGGGGGGYSRISHSYSWVIFGHVMCLDQSGASEKIWWIIIAIITHPLIFEWFYWLLYVTWYKFSRQLSHIITHPLIFEWFYWLLYVTWYKFSGQLSRNNPRPSRYLSSDCFRRGET